ncbi:LysR family transcriptional regulator [Roseomonas sp. OT10]|uniref:LysR family transcriptional regulator n=1 Tax=Roseomonas cutis TaxID=2897332 RepID=UPI001E60640F|nr:LysR family transcriptional regulator [Roseomonas sp. OT10]UFN47363.1 LysR family transcriptional regulator [Roseomonas sp. OT10]
MDPVSARLFVATIETGSIAKAAEREHIVPSAVSKRLSELEALVGTPLFERGLRGVRPTPAGEAFEHHARMVLRMLDRMEDEMSDYAEGVRGHVRVRASASSLTAGLPADIRDFLRERTHLRLDLEEIETPGIVRDVAEGRADIGIGPNLFIPGTLQLFPYRSYDLCVAVPEGHPLAQRPSVSYLETLEYDQVEQTTGSVLAQLMDGVARQASVMKRTRIRVRGFDTLCRMVGAGMGIGLAPSVMEASLGGRYGLRFIPLTDHWARPQICIMVRDVDSLSCAARDFVEHLRARSLVPGRTETLRVAHPDHAAFRGRPPAAR